MKKEFHVVPSGEQWAVRNSAQGTIVKKAPTQKAAVAVAKELIRKNPGGIVVH